MAAPWLTSDRHLLRTSRSALPAPPTETSGRHRVYCCLKPLCLGVTRYVQQITNVQHRTGVAQDGPGKAGGLFLISPGGACGPSRCWPGGACFCPCAPSPQATAPPGLQKTLGAPQSPGGDVGLGGAGPGTPRRPQLSCSRGGSASDCQSQRRVPWSLTSGLEPTEQGTTVVATCLVTVGPALSWVHPGCSPPLTPGGGAATHSNFHGRKVAPGPRPGSGRPRRPDSLLAPAPSQGCLPSAGREAGPPRSAPLTDEEAEARVREGTCSGPHGQGGTEQAPAPRECSYLLKATSCSGVAGPEEPGSVWPDHRWASELEGGGRLLVTVLRDT